MTIPEGHSSASREREHVLLLSDLNDLFREQAARIEVHQPQDWSLPAELVLAARIGSLASVEVRQRLQDGMEYVINHRDESNERDLCLVSGTQAKAVWLGMPDMTLDDILAYRRLISVDKAVWDSSLAIDCAAGVSCFTIADGYKRVKPGCY